MGKEVLYVPEEELKYVIRILRAGIKVEKPPKEVRDALLAWCKEEEEYLREGFFEEFWP